MSTFVKKINQLIKAEFGGVPYRLAKLAGISPGTFDKYIKGKSAPGEDILLRIHKATGASIDWLLLEEETQPSVREPPSIYGHTDEEKEYIQKLLEIFKTKDKVVVKSIIDMALKQPEALLKKTKTA